MGKVHIIEQLVVGAPDLIIRGLHLLPCSPRCAISLNMQLHFILVCLLVVGSREILQLSSWYLQHSSVFSRVFGILRFQSSVVSIRGYGMLSDSPIGTRLGGRGASIARGGRGFFELLVLDYHKHNLSRKDVKKPMNEWGSAEGVEDFPSSLEGQRGMRYCEWSLYAGRLCLVDNSSRVEC